MNLEKFADRTGMVFLVLVLIVVLLFGCSPATTYPPAVDVLAPEQGIDPSTDKGRGVESASETGMVPASNPDRSDDERGLVAEQQTQAPVAPVSPVIPKEERFANLSRFAVSASEQGWRIKGGLLAVAVFGAWYQAGQPWEQPVSFKGWIGDYYDPLTRTLTTPPVLVHPEVDRFRLVSPKFKGDPGTVRESYVPGCTSGTVWFQDGPLQGTIARVIVAGLQVYDGAAIKVKHATNEVEVRIIDMERIEVAP